MPLKLKLPGGEGKRTKGSQPNSSPKPSPNYPTDRKYTPSKSHRHHSTNVESVCDTPSDEDYSPVFDGGNNNFSPVASPQSAPETWGTPKYDQKRRPKSVSEPVQPDDVGVRSKESKPGRNRAFSVSRSGKFKEAKRRTSLLEIQDRFDKASKGEGEQLSSGDTQDRS